MDGERGGRCGAGERRPVWRGAALLVAALPVLPGIAAADGTYVRVGAGVERSADARFTDADCATNGLYGCGEGTDGAPYSSVGDFGDIAGVGFGVGRRVAPVLRVEGVVHFRPSATYGGRANFLAPDRRQSVSAGLSAITGLALAYVDLPGLGPLRPFVGGGAGASRFALDEMTMTFPRTITLVPAGRRTSFAWTASAGVAVPVGGAATLDAAWRYLASGRVATGAGTGRVLLHDGGVHYRDGRPNEFLLGETRARLAGHGLQLSLRYGF